MKQLMEYIAETREEVELHTIVADLSEALDYIANLDESLYDAISRTTLWRILKK